MKSKQSGGASSPGNDQGMAETTIITRVLASVQQLDAQTWNDLLALQSTPTPFMRHEYLAAMEQSGSATAETGWIARIITIWDGDALLAACPLYIKTHSYGEYVFDWAWARAYEQHGLPYYPKAVMAVPFTPVPGSRLLARSAQLRAALVLAVQEWASEMELSSLHLLFGDAQDLAACESAGWMQRTTVQFHWTNKAPTLPTACGSLPPEGAQSALGRPGGGLIAPTLPTARSSLPPEGGQSALGRPGGGLMLAKPAPWRDFDDFLSSLNQEKRKKIRQERRKVSEAGVTFRTLAGKQISAADWAFFYHCYERTYLEHGNPPYLTPAFFETMAQTLPENWVMFVAERNGQPMACSLIAISDYAEKSDSNPSTSQSEQVQTAIKSRVAYGRYWGALERVDCLHFEACYYQPIEWCIANGFTRFEGGAQGEHKMARALLPVETPSAHWVAHPAFADAIARFLQREGVGMADYLQTLQTHSPLRQTN